MQSDADRTQRAKHLRQTQTRAEALLWSVLRTKQLCGLKFRRQHSVGPFFADFACLRHKLIIELDGGYHDEIQEADISRQEYLERNGWNVLRFENEIVLDDVEAVAIAIAKELALPYELNKRNSDGSGMLKRKKVN